VNTIRDASTFQSVQPPVHALKVEGVQGLDLGALGIRPSLADLHRHVTVERGRDLRALIAEFPARRIGLECAGDFVQRHSVGQGCRAS
jgi:hypothetical protein